MSAKKSNYPLQRVSPELVKRAKEGGYSTTAYTKKLIEENDLLKGIVNNLGAKKDGKQKKKYDLFGGLKI